MMIEANFLDAGEKILWQDKPNIDVYFKRRNTFIPNLWLGLGTLFAGAGLATVVYQVEQLRSAFGAMSAALLIVGALLIYIRIRYRRDARRISYALTDRRAIIDAPGILFSNLISTPYSDIRSFEIREDEYGDVIFAAYVVETEQGNWLAPNGFFAIENVREVSRLLRSAVEKATGNSIGSVTQ